MTELDPKTMRQAFAARDRAWDGRFVVAVATTGIYCRPSCPARRPKAENCRFYPSNESAEAAGYRACKRCLPAGVTRERAAIDRAIDLLNRAEGRVGLARLAAETGYSPAHLQRVFTRATGLSPARYARALREERARQALSRGGPVTQAIYRAGFESPSRFYESMEGKLGMAPSAWARGGAGVTIEWAVALTTLGPMLVAASDKGVCRLAFGETVDDLARRFPNARLAPGGKDFAALMRQVVAAVEQPGVENAIPLDVRGTAFQERVWCELRRIPPGETRSYSEIAAAAGNPKAVRAAGSANGANHVAVLIPCHRVVRSDGSTGGYAYGSEIKQELLRRESEGG